MLSKKRDDLVSTSPWKICHIKQTHGSGVRADSTGYVLFWCPWMRARAWIEYMHWRFLESSVAFFTSNAYEYPYQNSVLEWHAEQILPSLWHQQKLPLPHYHALSLLVLFIRSFKNEKSRNFLCRFLAVPIVSSPNISSWRWLARCVGNTYDPLQYFCLIDIE